MHGLTVGAGMGLVNAGWQCKAIKSENNAISRRLHSSCRRCPEFLEPLDFTQPFASHTNNHQLSALAQPDLGKAHLYLKLQQSVNGGLCPFKALTPDEFMTPLCLLFLKQSTPGLQKLHTLAHCSLQFLQSLVLLHVSQPQLFVLMSRFKCVGLIDIVDPVGLGMGWLDHLGWVSIFQPFLILR